MKYFVLFLYCFALFLTAHSGAIRAQDSLIDTGADIARLNFSEEEKVGFAFYNLIARDPPYESWIMNSDPYIKMMPDDRIHYMDAERNRLKNGIANFSLKKDLIRVRIMSDLTIRPDAENETMVMDVQIPEFSDGLAFFPFKLGEQWIAVIPMDMSHTMSYPLTLEELALIDRDLGTRSKGRKNVAVEILLLPVSADDKSPMTLDEKSMVLMMAEVASFYLLDDKNRIPIWGYTAPWYNSSVREQVMDLYKE